MCHQGISVFVRQKTSGHASRGLLPDEYGQPASSINLPVPNRGFRGKVTSPLLNACLADSDFNSTVPPWTDGAQGARGPVPRGGLTSCPEGTRVQRATHTPWSLPPWPLALYPPWFLNSLFSTNFVELFKELPRRLLLPLTISHVVLFQFFRRPQRIQP